MNVANRELLQRQVDTRNKVNRKANELRAEFVRVLEPFVGKKVIKEKPYRSWTKRVAEAIEVLTSGASYMEGCHLVFDCYNYNVWASLKCTYPVSEYGVEYVTREFVVCTLDNDLLQGFPLVEPARTDYTVDEVTIKFVELEKLKDRVAKVKSQLREFIK